MSNKKKSVKKLDNIRIKEQKKRIPDTSLLLNSSIFNNSLEYLPSDFNKNQIRRMFVREKSMSLPKGCNLEIFLYPNDTEKTLKVIVVIDKYYKNGIFVQNKKMFKPFWIVGFNQLILNVEPEKPSENKYRRSNNPVFAFKESENIIRRKISSKLFSPETSNYKIEKDFRRAREAKNQYIRNYINRLNKIPNSTWECVPNVKINWKKKKVDILLFIKKETVKNNVKIESLQSIDRFVVKMGDLLDNKDNKKGKSFDINTMCYLVALNAIYKNVKIFSYNTLYEVYKLLSMKLLERGFKLDDLTVDNLTNLKLIDFSKHFVCYKKMFNDRLLHIMNMMSSAEEYYRMKFVYTAQKNPAVLYSEFIVKEFKNVQKNNLNLILRNSEEKYWRSLVDKIDEINLDTVNNDKDFYINNYNVFEISNKKSRNVESFLMDYIKSEKDDITRLTTLGEEILEVTDQDKFTKKELEDLKKSKRKERKQTADKKKKEKEEE